MNTDVDPENELVQLIVEEVVRAGLRTPLREPILAAVESESGAGVEVEQVGAAASTEEFTEGTDGDATGDEGSGEGEAADVETDAAEKGTVTKAARGLLVFGVMFTVLYLTLRRLTD